MRVIGTTQLLPNVDPGELTRRRFMKHKNDRYRESLPIQEVLLIWIERPAVAAIVFEIGAARFHLDGNKTAASIPLSVLHVLSGRLFPHL